MDILLASLKHSLMITVFVFVMLMLVDYLNVLTRGEMSMGCSIGTVMSRLHRGRILLRKKLNYCAVEHGYSSVEAIAGQGYSSI